MEHLSALDAAFLEAEDADPHVSLAIGSVTVLDGPAPSQTELVGSFGGRLLEAPRFGQKVRMASLDLASPAWVDDPDFDLGYHLRRTALPEPGDDAALCRLVARVMSQRLDRDRPLWECWIIEGLAGGRWAVLMKVHHCIADGISGSHLYETFADPTPSLRKPKSPAKPKPKPPEPSSSWPGAALRTVTDVVTSPMRWADAVVGVLSGVQRLLAELFTPAAPTSLSGPIGRARRYGIARASLADVREIASAFDATVNDVALAAITGAFRAVLVSRGERPMPDAVRTLVPVSTRSDGQEHIVDNRVSAMLAFLPVDVTDPVQRLTEVRSRLRALKSSGESEGGASAVALGRYVPAAPIAWLVRLIARLPQRSIITVTTNVPGPDHVLSVLGRPIREIWPIVPIAVQLRTGVAILSYADRLTFGITADYRTAPEIALLTGQIERGVAELLSAARSRRKTRRPLDRTGNGAPRQRTVTHAGHPHSDGRTSH